jgi:hypothetical protein
MAKIVTMFPQDVAIVRRGGRWRKKLRIKNGPMVSVLMARPVKVLAQTVRWFVDPVSHERHLVTLLARWDVTNGSFRDFYVLPRVDRSRRFTLNVDDNWLRAGIALQKLQEFLDVVRATQKVRKEILQKYC